MALSSLRRLTGALVVSALSLAVTVPPRAGAASPDAARAGALDAARAGASGIGDPYFPLDGNGGIDVRHYGIDVAYDFATGRLRGRTTLTLTATQTLRSFGLDFLLPVTGVRVDGKRATVRTPGRHEVRIAPRRVLAAGTTHRVTVRYAGRPGAWSYLGERNWLASGDEVVTMNQPHMAPWWFPANDHPADKATYDITVRVPRGRQVVANGVLAGKRRVGDDVRWHWRARDPMASYLAFFAAGDFVVDRGHADGRPFAFAVSRGLPRQERATAMRWLRRTPGIVRWLEGEVGTYPFEATGGLVTSLGVGFALENQTRPTYPFAGAPDWLLVHELSHQWFGDSVAVRRWSDIWLNEGLATYFEQRWAETHGGQSAVAWLEQMYGVRGPQDSFWTVRVDDPGADRIFDGAVYTRGGMAMVALRRVIGHEAFATLLRRWVGERAGGHGTTAEFVALAEEVSGRQLGSFFDAWLSTPRRPDATAANGLA